MKKRLVWLILLLGTMAFWFFTELTAPPHLRQAFGLDLRAITLVFASAEVVFVGSMAILLANSLDGLSWRGLVSLDLSRVRFEPNSPLVVTSLVSSC